MENRLASHNRRPDPPTSARDGHMKESRRLGYQLKYESTNISSELLQKKQDNGKDPQNEELVRYMSNLPSFLKKDVKLNEKTFSVGVLDWKQLEKWQNFHNIGNQHSSARSNFSSCSSTGGSSSHSSDFHSLPPARQKLGCPTLQSHFYGTPIENGSHDIESAEVRKLKAQDCKSVPSRLSGVQKTIIRTQLPSNQKVEHRPKACKEKDPKVTQSSMARRSCSSEDVTESMKIPDCESSRRHHKMRTSFDQYTADEVYARKQENSSYEPGSKYPQISRSLNLSDIKKFGSKKASHLSFSSTDNFEASCTEPFCNMPPSRPPQADVSHLHIEEPCSGASQDNKISNDLFQRFSDCGDVSGNTSRGKNLQEEKSIPAVVDQVLVNPSKACNTKMVSWGTTTVRNPSPTRRFSFSLSRVGKVSNASTTTGTSVAAEEAAVSSSSLNNSKAGSKGRSSPLRRLLDPLKRPARASLSETRSNEPASKSSEAHGDSTVAHSVKVKLDLKTCKNVDAEVPHCSSKRVSSTVQALLQVAVRNGFPLFTFAVDNKNDILAATMRKPNSGKEEFGCIYSFFNVQELKKRSGGWINHGRKDKGNNFVPNIVAQMKVTDSFEQNSDQSISKEYVLFSFDTKQAETSGHELNDELAAVVVKILKKSSHLCQNWQGHESSDDSPTSMLKEPHPLSNVKCNSGSGNIGDNQTEDQFCMTVLLPGGHHGQPIKGEPSSLVKRWQSGGSCDCGGWDLGCRMRVLTENAQSRQISSSAKSHHTNKLLELFSQDGEGQKPVFSLASFKDGIYAVEFNSSIEILQAFSIALSILSCLKPVEFVALRNGLNEKPSADITVSETGDKKVYGKTQREVSAFISNPPLSPVGRV